MVACGLVEILYIPTEHQLADILTKNLSAEQFLYLRSMMTDPRELYKYAEYLV
jgi:hypothetical protein